MTSRERHVDTLGYVHYDPPAVNGPCDCDECVHRRSLIGRDLTAALQTGSIEAMAQVLREAP